MLALQQHVREHGEPDAAGVAELSRRLGMPAASVRAALSFYDDLHAPPDAVRVCDGTSCMLAGAEALHRAVEKKHPCRGVYCLGYCDRSPAMLDADDHVHARCEPDADAVSRAVDPGAVEIQLAMPAIRCTASRPVVTQRIGKGDHASLGAARDAGVYEGLKLALGLRPIEVIELVEQSGERGRGGAGYPTAAKWRVCAQTASDERYVIANGDEGDPGSFIDRVLMEHDAHAVLEGMAVAAYAVGARNGIVFIRSEYPRAIEVMRRAIREAEEAGLLGDRVLGKPFDFHVTVIPGLGSYVCGEETAMLNAIEGRRGEVRLRPPYPAERGLYGKPTIVNNVETLVNIGWIVHHGPDAYRAMGTDACSGTKAMCLNHGFARPGIVEVEFGTPLRALLEDEAGGPRDGEPLEAILLGGPMGSLLTPEQWDAPICYHAMGELGIQLGHGGVVALPRGTDFRAMLVHLLGFMKHESCGKCVPCRVGSERAFEIAASINGGPDNANVTGQLRRLFDVMADGSLCAFGQLMPGPLRTIVERFGDRVFADGGER